LRETGTCGTAAESNDEKNEGRAGNPFHLPDLTQLKIIRTRKGFQWDSRFWWPHEANL
jgi:hypothetical protein